jgi:TPR repeat protein
MVLGLGKGLVFAFLICGFGLWGSTREVKAAQDPPKAHLLTVSTQPDGARVYANKSPFCAATPCTKSMRSGTYHLDIELENHQNATIDVELRQDRSVSMELVSDGAYYDIITYPPAILLQLDNEKPSHSPLKQRRLKMGEHRVDLIDRCFVSDSLKFRVSPPLPQTIELFTQKQFTALHIKARDKKGNDVKADVFIDGKNVGQTFDPLSTELCSSNIQINHPEHGTYQGRLNLATQESTELEITLFEPQTWQKFLSQAKSDAVACENSDILACYRLAQAYRRGEGLAQDHAQSWKLFNKACEGGHMPSCNQAGYFMDHGMGVDENPKEAFAYYEKACHGGIMEGCNNQGAMYEQGRGVIRSADEAVPLYRRACYADDMPACNNLGRAYALGAGAPIDYEKSHEFYEKSCKGSYAQGCRNLGWLYSQGLGVSKSIEKAGDYYSLACESGLPVACHLQARIENVEPSTSTQAGLKHQEHIFILEKKACDAGYGPSCRNLGKRYEYATAIDQDLPQARKLYRRSCTQNDPEGCHLLGLLYSKGLGVTQDENHAQTLFEKACGKDFAPACREQAWSTYNIRATPKETLKLLGKACEGKDAIACNQLALSHIHANENSEKVSQGAGQAALLLRRACLLKDTTSCSNLAQLYEKGHGLRRDSHKAKLLYEYTCHRNSAESCNNLGLLLNEQKLKPDASTEADSFFLKACRLGSGEACHNLALSLEENSYGERSSAYIVPLYTQACDSDIAPACFNLAQKLRGAPAHDAEKITQHYQKACRLGHAGACINAAKSLESPFPKDDTSQEVENSYARACELGEPQGCAQLAYARIRAGGNTDSRISEIKDLLQKACQRGTLNACVNAAVYQQQTSGADPKAQGHQSNSQDTFARACQKGIREACVNEGQEHEVIATADAFNAAAKAYTQACTLGSVKGCRYLGDLMQTPSNPNKKVSLAQQAYAKACRMKDAKGCYQAGLLKETNVPKSYLKAAQWYFMGCELNEGQACTNLGRLYEKGRGLTQENSRARQLYEKGCKLNDSEGCNNLGQFIENVDKTRQRFLKVHTLYAKACHSKSSSIACFNLSRLLLAKGLSRPIARKIQKRLQKDCEAGRGESCLGLALAYDSKQTNRAKKSTPLYIKACILGFPESCYNAGMNYERGWSIQKDKAQAIVYYKKACLGGYAKKACNQWGNLLAQSASTEEVQKEAFSLYSRGCEAGDYRACTNLGVALIKGRGQDTDDTRGVQLLQQSCEQGETNACAHWGFALREGIGAQQDKIKGQSILKEACRKKETWACKRAREQ